MLKFSDKSDNILGVNAKSAIIWVKHIFFQESSHAIVNWKSIWKYPATFFDKINCWDGARRQIINISNQELKSCSTISLLDV